MRVWSRKQIWFIASNAEAICHWYLSGPICNRIDISVAQIEVPFKIHSDADPIAICVTVWDDRRLLLTVSIVLALLSDVNNDTPARSNLLLSRHQRSLLLLLRSWSLMLECLLLGTPWPIYKSNKRCHGRRNQLFANNSLLLAHLRNIELRKYLCSGHLLAPELLYEAPWACRQVSIFLAQNTMLKTVKSIVSFFHSCWDTKISWQHQLLNLSNSHLDKLIRIDSRWVWTLERALRVPWRRRMRPLM